MRTIHLLFYLIVVTCKCTLFAQDLATYAKKVIWGEEKTVLTFDASEVKRPPSPASFQPHFHLPPIRQDTTGTCWCFAGTSFLESELKRLGRGEIKLSEMHTVYWEYVEKARHFIRTRGRSEFSQGSQPGAVLNRIRHYGAVPAQDYSGLLAGKTRHNHQALANELNAYLEFIQKNNYWNEDQGIESIKLILNKHLGTPPATITVAGKQMTPVEFAQNILALPLDDYVNIISFMKTPFYELTEFEVPDNWWQDSTYYNLPLDEFYSALKTALSTGYTAAVATDVSEPGRIPELDICIIPTFDLPQTGIDQSAREYRFYNHSSTDDHSVHVIGCQTYQGYDWFLIKDSGSSSHEGRHKGYYFYRDDFVRLKVLTALLHKNAIKKYLKKFDQ